jgi:MerC mercury resistance protein
MKDPGSRTVAVLDHAGMSASLACAVHCAALPLLLAALPAAGLAWLDSAWIDWAMVAVAAGIAFRAHGRGFSVHRHCLPPSLAVLGVLLIVATICLLKGSTSQHYLQASGAVVIASSHALNHRFCRSCAKCSGRSER